MNERIRELWTEATQRVWPRPGKFTAGEYDYHLEKFAELIVLDCLGVLKRRFMGDLNREDMEVKRCIEDVKEHFGVEE